MGQQVSNVGSFAGSRSEIGKPYKNENGHFVFTIKKQGECYKVVLILDFKNKELSISRIKAQALWFRYHPLPVDVVPYIRKVVPSDFIKKMEIESIICLHEPIKKNVFGIDCGNWLSVILVPNFENWALAFLVP